MTENYVVIPINLAFEPLSGRNEWTIEQVQVLVSCLDAIPEALVIIPEYCGYDVLWRVYFDGLDMPTMRRKISEAITQAHS